MPYWNRERNTDHGHRQAELSARYDGAHYIRRVGRLDKNTDLAASISGVKWSDSNPLSNSDRSGSIAFNHILTNGSVFGEFARGYNNTQGAIAGLRLKYPNVMYLLSARYYAKGYSALRANPLAEWVGDDRNELGIYQGINFKFRKHQIIPIS